MLYINSSTKVWKLFSETHFSVDWKLLYTVLYISVNPRLSSLQWYQNVKNGFLLGRVTLKRILAGSKENVTNFNTCTPLSHMFKEHYCLSLAGNLWFQKSDNCNKPVFLGFCCTGVYRFLACLSHHLLQGNLFPILKQHSTRAFPKIGCNLILG